MRTKSQGDP